MGDALLSYLPGSLMSGRPRDCVQPSLEIGERTGDWPCKFLPVDVAPHSDGLSVAILNCLANRRKDTDQRGADLRTVTLERCITHRKRNRGSARVFFDAQSCNV